MKRSIETVIIGGGQGGLSTSYHLGQRGREHVVLEQATQAGNAWRNDRWDSFTFVTPNWTFQLPGAPYQGDAPDGFMARDEIVAAFEQYENRFRLPVEHGVRVVAVAPGSDGEGYVIYTDGDIWEARNVVVATGLFQQPKRLPFSVGLSPDITQLDSGRYRNPAALAPGAVLVVGSAQSGCQIAEELYQSGRRVYLCIGSAGRAPRRYRGRDIFKWLALTHFLDRTVDKLPSPRAKFAGNPHVTGRDGGHSLNLHQFARDGVTLLGRLEGGTDHTLWLASDLKENLAKADKFEADLVKMINGYIAQAGFDAPEETLPQLSDGYEAEVVTELDLHAVGITTIIWALGYSFDFSLVKLPAIVDGDGFPVQHQGVTAHSGLYFAGMPWMDKQSSGFLFGVGEQAEVVASAIAGASR